MNRENHLFMQALSAALKDEAVQWDLEVTGKELLAVLALAESHRVLPMVYQTVHTAPAAAEADPAALARYRRSAMQMVMLQTRKTAEFLPLLEALREAGVDPIVVKGITCRNLYPNPDHRLSSDEDVLIPPENYEKCHEILRKFGLNTPDPETGDYEVPYRGQQSSLYLEIHRSLFPPESQAYGAWNEFFTNARSRREVIDGIPTLHPTDHMLYLLCHAFKHFIHSGFGIRQVCDMILFANRFGSRINWLQLLECCREIRAEKFAAGLFAIGKEYLGFDWEQAKFPRQWQIIRVEETNLLEDVLRAGVYGSADRSRQHSSTITLNAVAARNQGKRKTGIAKTVFPSAKTLEGRYPYLKDKPILLPVAWTQRLVQYGRESGKPDNRAGESLRIGAERIALLKQYGVLDK